MSDILGSSHLSDARTSGLPWQATMSRHYVSARQHAKWSPNDIGWTDGDLSAAWREWSWRVTSASVYAEQTGMIMAAKLSYEVDDLPARMCLATAASDEAKHIETFAKAAEILGGHVMPVREDTGAVYDQLIGLPDWMDRFVIHTLLESYAADEFLLIGRRLGMSFPGQCYRFVRRDEARHVAMGLDYLAFRLKDKAFRNTAERLPELQTIADRVGGVDDTFYQNLAKLVGQNAISVRQWFEHRHAVRLKQLQATTNA